MSNHQVRGKVEVDYLLLLKMDHGGTKREGFMELEEENTLDEEWHQGTSLNFLPPTQRKQC